MPLRIVALGYSEASMLLRNPGDVTVVALLSIHGQREFAVDPSPHIAHVLTLRFDDCRAAPADDPIEQSRHRLRQREAMDIGLEFSPPTIDHARAIIEFARRVAASSEQFGHAHHEAPAPVPGYAVDRRVFICTCFAGISRSPAAALLTMAAWFGPGREREYVDYLRRVRPAAVPHPDLIAFGDAELGLGGRLIEAISG